LGKKSITRRIIEFIDKRWKLNLGAVNAKLYKIAPFLELRNKNDANDAAFGALTFCRDQLGKPAQQQTGLFIWDTTDGNVILQTAEAQDGFAVNLFLTANSTRDFERL
jgi:hypothetical protein